MDSITQIALGAAIGEAVSGRQAGKRAVLWGGICGLMPDLDVLIPFSDAVKAFTYHRGPSHSLFVLTALTPIIVFLILKLHPQTIEFKKRWYALVFTAFITHVLLDCFTVYGTQIFWPLDTPPVMWSTIFIIDPIYSVPLIIGVIASLIMTRSMSRANFVNMMGLILSTLYLAWSAGANLYVTNVARKSMNDQNVSYQQLITIPTAFNTLLWRVLAVDNQTYYEGFYSLLDKTNTIKINSYPRNKQHLENLENYWTVRRLKWFTHGFYSVEKYDEAIVITDLRMGMEPYYVFRFKIAEEGNPHPQIITSQRVPGQRSKELIKRIWHRIGSVES